MININITVWRNNKIRLFVDHIDKIKADNSDNYLGIL